MMMQSQANSGSPAPSAYRYARLHEEIGVHDGGQLMQQVWCLFKELRGGLSHNLFKLVSCSTRHSVPCLWFPPACKAWQITHHNHHHTISNCKTSQWCQKDNSHLYRSLCGITLTSPTITSIKGGGGCPLKNFKIHIVTYAYEILLGNNSTKRAAHQTYDIFNAGKHMTVIYTENIY